MDWSSALATASQCRCGDCQAMGELSAQRSRPVVDTLLAATALVHKLTLVTRNISDVHDLGVKLLDPWRKSEQDKVSNWPEFPEGRLLLPAESEACSRGGFPLLFDVVRWKPPCPWRINPSP